MGRRFDIAHRLRRRFVLSALAAVALVLAVIIAAINITNYMTLCDQADARLAFIASCDGDLSQVMENKSSYRRNPELKKRLASYDLSFEALFEMRYFTVTVGADGEVRTVDIGRIAEVDIDEARGFARDLAAQGRDGGFLGTLRFVTAEVPAADGSGDGHATMYIFLDCSRDLAKFRSYLVASVAVGAVGLLLVFALVLAFSRIVLRPVVESYEKQRRFVTDASHEIKTPLAVIDAADEVLEIEHGASEWTDSIHEQVARLSTLTEQLVLLSRMDEGGDSLALSEMDLAKTVREAAEPFFALARARGKRLEADIEPVVAYRGDVGALAHIVELLLDNATRYASDGSTIRLSLAARGAHGAELRVANRVDEMPAGDLNRLFERFYRPDASRSSQTGGSGVGLSIVSAIAEAHGGRASASSEGDAITFTVRL